MKLTEYTTLYAALDAMDMDSPAGHILSDRIYLIERSIPSLAKDVMQLIRKGECPFATIGRALADMNPHPLNGNFYADLGQMREIAQWAKDLLNKRKEPH